MYAKNVAHTYNIRAQVMVGSLLAASIPQKYKQFNTFTIFPKRAHDQGMPF